jgi:hypothetical protein
MIRLVRPLSRTTAHGRVPGRVVPVPSKVTTPRPPVEQLVDELHAPDRMIYGIDYSWRGPRRQYPLVKMRRIWQAISPRPVSRLFLPRPDPEP